MAYPDLKEIDALIHLLDDSDNEVVTHVSEKLIAYGNSILGNLERASEDHFNPLIQERIEGIIRHIQYDRSANAFRRWSREGVHDLLKAALILGRHHDPGIDEGMVLETMSEIAEECRTEISPYQGPVETISILNQVLYKNRGFQGRSTDLLNPAHYQIHVLLRNKNGVPLTLGLLYLILGQMLGLRLYGVNLPHHFIIGQAKAEIDDFNATDGALMSQILFYINPANAGMVFTKYEIEEYLKKIELSSRPEFFVPISNLQTIEIVVRTLKLTYETRNQVARCNELDGFLKEIGR